MKRSYPIHFFLLIFFTVFLFFTPAFSKIYAQQCTPDDPDSCGGGLVCDELSFECAPPKIGSGAACKTNLNECIGDMSCIPDTTGSEDGKCGVPTEGSLCNPTNTQSCGASTFSPLSCDATSQTCKRTTCDPARGSADCTKPSFSCVQEGDGAYCKFVSSSNRTINVRINYHDVININSRYVRDGIKADLLRNGKVVTTRFSTSIEISGKGKNTDEDINDVKYIQFTDVAPGDYEVCIEEAGQCRDVKKDVSSPGQPDPVVFNVEACAQNKNAKSFICEDPIAPPPPPCEFRDAEKCRSFNTAIGSLSTNPGRFISSIFAVLLAISGAIALILILRAGYKMMTSKGEPEKIKDAREQLIAAIVGLMFLIFSLVFLELIGFSLLRIPGFTGSASSAPINSDRNGDLPELPDIPTNPQAGCTERILKPGDNGDCVEGLQRILGVSPVNGIYNSDTENAVIGFQREKGIYVDGIVGPCTWGAITQDSIDPICSEPLTPENIRKFQEKKGLKADGTLNECTYKALTGIAVPDSCKP